MTEQDIQNEIRMELSKYGMVFRTNSGKAFTADGRIINLLPKGFTDLLFCGFDGQVAFIEVKTSTGIVREEQEKFIKLMRSHGYKAGVARSVNDAIKIIKGSDTYTNNGYSKNYQ